MTHSQEMSTQDNSETFLRRLGSHRTVNILCQACLVPFLVTVDQQTNFCSPGQVPNVTSIVVEQGCS